MVSKSTPKGMRDLLPDDMMLREQIIDAIRSVFRKYGFVPLETPAMEYLDTLKAKAGGEVEKQIFTVEDDMGLRFDLTVPLARVMAASSFPRPFKRYQIGKAWRKEEPQKGRFREFWQADADIIGSPGMRAEAELLTMANEILAKLGFGKPEIVINNRKILDALAKKLNIENKKNDVFRILDKIDKIGESEVRAMMADVIGEKVAGEFFGYVSVKGGNAAKIAAAKKISPEGGRELEEMVSLLDFPVEVDLALVRGLGYYTGPVFEIKLSKDMGSVAAGGRYDDLLGLYGQPDSAVGISFGLDRIIALMRETGTEKGGMGTGKGKMEGRKTFTQVFVCSVKNEFYANALSVANELRAAGIAAETDLNERNLKKQFDYANALGIRHVVVIGGREAKEGKVTLRDMKSGKEELTDIKRAVARIKAE